MRRTATAVLAGAALAAGGCAHGAGAPTSKDVREVLESELLTPLADPTRIPGRYIVEFAPRIEVRKVSCVPAGKAFACDLEVRVVDWFGAVTQDWGPRRVRVFRQMNGRWRLARGERLTP